MISIKNQLRDRRSRLGFERLESRCVLTALISEFMASNDSTIADGDGNFSDWIEIKNIGTETLNLAGWHLTDSQSTPDKWTFPNLTQSTLDPGEYLIVFASGQSNEGYVDPQGYLHTDFKLRAAGEYLAITDASRIVVHEYAPEYPPQATDVSYGVLPGDPQTGVYFDSPTPGAANSPAAVSDRVELSRTSSTFVGSFELTMTGMQNSSQSIVYTLDGSVPTASSTVYSDPLSIAATTQVRARIVEPGKSDGPIVTGSYSRLGADLRDFESQLPIVLVENFGAGNIPSKDWNQTGAGIRQVDRQSSAVSIFNNSSGTATLNQADVTHSRSGIRTRGAFSTTFPEPQYSLETWGEDNDDQAIEVLGMAEESDWILYSPNPVYDQTLMNNQIMFELTRPTTVWAPEFQFVEMFLNTDGGDVTMDDHVGLYVWTEKVKRDSGRIDFDRFAPDGSSGGWLLSINRMDPIPADDPRAIPQHMHTPGPNGVLETSPNASGEGDDIPRQYNAFMNFEHPNGYDLNPVQRQAIEDWFAEMEDVLYDRSDVRWNDPVNGYAKYIDVENFVDYFILHNLSRNGDGLLLSLWIYNPDPNNGGKLKFGPPWDHDLGAFEGNPSSSLLHRADRLWYARLFQDPAFVQTYEQRWQMWRQSILSDESMNAVFDDLLDEIGEDAIERDGVSNIQSRIRGVTSWLESRAAAIDNATGPPIVADRRSGSPPLRVQFTDDADITQATSWQWDFGDGNQSTSRNPVHTYTASGFYDVELTVTASSGQTYTYAYETFVEVMTAGDVTMNGVLDADDIAQFIENWRADTRHLDDFGKVTHGDLNRDGTTDFLDWHILRVAWNAQNGSGFFGGPIRGMHHIHAASADQVSDLRDRIFAALDELTHDSDQNFKRTVSGEALAAGSLPTLGPSHHNRS